MITFVQAIIRGLKEPDVFTNAVTSAKAQSKTKPSNMGLGNKEAMAIQPNVTAGQSTLEGGHERLQATVRKILEMVDAQEQEEAMPPRPSPGLLELSERATALS
ncbi:Glycosyltransferase-like KOBITO 1 [Zea mays]|uniref:Glycosyltransferase-like KOBITO 1 n=1 Tax=Zea mays TaxID=4577 RepID=A0A1D6QT60_MAIZE|nr:Glycosyltransferase-like KOBITO 1 [Zea mays]AQL05256.1 Glycosyltransferase-like KOBITO 1 [Zea mays]